MKKSLSTHDFVLLALLVAVLIVLGMVNIPQPAGLSITFNMIPVAIAAIALGVKGGAIIGGAFGLISFLQCFGLFGYSGMGAALTGISPVLSFIQRFVSRLLVGVCTALVYRALNGRAHAHVASVVTGFSAAFLNTLFFMSSLVLLFGRTDYMRNLIAGRSVMAFIVASVGVNAVVEMLVAAALTGAISAALHRAGLIRPEA